MSTADTSPARPPQHHLRPGTNLVRVLAVLALTSVGVFLIPGVSWLLPVCWSIVLGIVVVDYRRARAEISGVTIARTSPPLAGRGRPIRVRWTITRTSTGPLLGEWRDCLPGEAQSPWLCERFSLTPGQFESTFSHVITIPIRGQFQFGPLWLRVESPWRLIELQWSVDGVHPIRVLPETYHSPDELLKDKGAQSLLLDKKSRARQYGVGTEFESLIEFRDGDDPRRIDWRTTARVGHPVVRRFQIERHRDVMLVVDCGRLMGADAGKGSKLDCAVDSALMLARIALQGGDRCGIALFDDQVLGYLPPMNGLSSINSLADCVYAAATRWRESDFTQMFARLHRQQEKRAFVVVISDIVDAETTQRFRASLARLTSRHVVLFAALKTPVLESIAAEDLRGPLDASRKAVAFRLLREREQALHSLRRGGIHVLDVTPDQLTVPLLNRFIELREGQMFA